MFRRDDKRMLTDLRYAQVKMNRIPQTNDSQCVWSAIDCCIQELVQREKERGSKQPNEKGE